MFVSCAIYEKCVFRVLGDVCVFRVLRDVCVVLRDMYCVHMCVFRVLKRCVCCMC